MNSGIAEDVAAADYTPGKSQESMDLDDLLPHVGEFGRYQKVLLWFVCLPSCLPCGFCAFNQLFMVDIPDHWCAIPDLDLPGISPQLRRHLAVPTTEVSRLILLHIIHRQPKTVGNKTVWDKCSRYMINWTSLLEENEISTITPNSSWPTETCIDGWEYDKSEIQSSIVIDFDLVCSQAIYPTIGLAALNFGGPIGVYGFGLLNDRLGRRISFFTCLATLITGNCLTALSPNFWCWATSRIIVGFTIPAVYQIPFIISLELVGPNYRSFVTVMTCMFYTIGLMLLAGITYLVRNWVHLCLVTSTPFLLYFIYWFFLPESPRWLLAKGRLEEAAEILENLAKINNKEFPPSFKQKLKQRMMLHRTVSEEMRLKRGPGVAGLWRTPNMRLKTSLITLNWFANEMVYVGLSYYGPALGSNQYLSFLLSSAVEIPSYLLCWMVMDHWGRRWPLSLSMIISGISCIITVLLPSDAVLTTLVLFLVSKSAISASFLIIYPFAGELYPTQLRGLGIGISAYIGGLGLIIIPFITYLGADNLVMPLIIMGTISVMGGLTSLRLPETLHHRLPQTVEEGEEFGKDWTWNDCIRCVPKKPEKSSSYEDLDNVELGPMKRNESSEIIPLRRTSMNRLMRQASVLDTQRDSDGAMKMTYWF